SRTPTATLCDDFERVALEGSGPWNYPAQTANGEIRIAADNASKSARALSTHLEPGPEQGDLHAFVKQDKVGDGWGSFRLELDLYGRPPAWDEASVDGDVQLLNVKYDTGTEASHFEMALILHPDLLTLRVKTHDKKLEAGNDPAETTDIPFTSYGRWLHLEA